ncbi:unnamed protein product [Victoria cruziana]
MVFSFPNHCALPPPARVESLCMQPSIICINWFWKCISGRFARCRSGSNDGLSGEDGTITGNKCPNGLYGTFCNECPIGAHIRRWLKTFIMHSFLI